MSKNRFSRNGKTDEPATDAAPTGAEVSNEIDCKLERLNQLWRNVERQLLTAAPPRHIAFDYQEHGDEYGDAAGYSCLGIQRYASKWRICQGMRSVQQSLEQASWKPITDCDVETRMEASKHIGRLQHHVDETRRTFLPELDEAISNLMKVVYADL